jgi:hypothetical protein
MSDVLSFYSAHGPHGFLSNFSPHGVFLDARYWPTVEHFYQAQKFAGSAYMEEVRLAKSPNHAKSLVRRRDWPLRADWEEVKVAVMRRAVLRKFWTHPAIRAGLLATGDLLLVENAPADTFWGCGADGSGRNMLGIILMEVRAALRLQAAAGSEIHGGH